MLKGAKIFCASRVFMLHSSQLVFLKNTKKVVVKVFLEDCLLHDKRFSTFHLGSQK